MPLWRRVLSLRFFFRTLAFGLAFTVIAACVASYLLRPYYERAKTFDLSLVSASSQNTAKGRSPVTLEDVPSHLIDALIATEDSRFYQHWGFDLVGILRATATNIRQRRNAEGASTITQQLARQTYNLRAPDYGRKATEIFLARRIEQYYSKREILQHYLNLVYFGNGFYGIGAASQGYYKKAPISLTLPESATLVGAIKRPRDYNPRDNPHLSTEVKNHTLRRMLAQGMITPTDYRALTGKPGKTKR